MERTLVILKPDAVQRGILGQIISRLERKGLQIAAMKMAQLSDALLEEHYRHHINKPFFGGLKQFMKSSPVVLMVVEGLDAVSVVRDLCGPTNCRKAPAGTIRGDFGMSQQSNLIHASDSVEAAQAEVARFFRPEEIHDYDRIDKQVVYAADER
ncbi:MAG TPA: nucleoside-diphosphate kinase [Armatimonadota bacterium]|nr:nucleoside-diphosphate kinase [Armatimonadota bacterium]